MDVKKLVKPNVLKLRAYRAEEIPCKVKLDANENPYGFRVLKNVKTNKYPDPEAKVILGGASNNVKDEFFEGITFKQLLRNNLATSVSWVDGIVPFG